MSKARENIGRDTKAQNPFQAWKKPRLTPRQKQIRKYRRTIERDDDYDYERDSTRP